MPRILAFDIGIKNLAWCCGDLSDSKGSCEIRGWANENLITGGTAESDTANNKCSSCGKNAGFLRKDTKFCVRHCPSLTPALRDLSGIVLKKIPALSVLKEIAGASNPKPSKVDLKSKVAVLAFLENHYCLPKPPAAKASKIEFESLHEGIRNMIIRNHALFNTCNEILLENQPVYKNPIMKSIQMMLFATLRDLLRVGSQPPKVRLVHAGKKTASVAAVAKGDEGYSERKNASEARVIEGFRTGKITGQSLDWFKTQAKRSDLADCLSMVLDCSVV